MSYGHSIAKEEALRLCIEQWNLQQENDIGSADSWYHAPCVYRAPSCFPSP
jgi:hypothetical protein